MYVLLLRVMYLSILYNISYHTGIMHDMLYTISTLCIIYISM